MSLVKQSLFAASLAYLSFAVAAPGMSAPRSMILGRQTTAFINIFSAPSCNDEDFLVALGINSGPIAGPENCVIHNSASEIASTQQPDGNYLVYIQPTTESLFGGSGEVIVRSPAHVDVENCGVAVDVLTSEGCFAVVLANTFFLQGCLKDDTACAPGPGRDQLLGPAVDPSCYSHGGTVTELANDQTQYDCERYHYLPWTGELRHFNHVSDQQSVSDTVSASITAGIEELFSATLGFSYTEETSTSTTTTFNVPPGGSGQITFTPVLTCVSGTTSGCGSDISDGDLKMCMHTTQADGSITGTLAFLNRA
ncbi:hypothetical protein CONLIGDRAFT_681197 [Coniochaeta ligniaria NRRL 30616]|uniref:Ubiquitin 3 binding protein But2 C-terminal domain-containing protein n=1 Tax=Coniochaeta ligniaria NRRL 30616 TaxID=1408157 RepID=A0A1J7JG44_9PEZI|nr:hypothetical protein CONLIGDRAFT_681197 [Coniochaeta ligniaria NRRL 30616]